MSKEDVIDAVRDPSIKDQLRSKILATKTPKSKIIDFMGEKIEIRQPTLKDIVEAQESGAGKNAIITALVSYAYIPGTNEKLFETEDTESLMELPFGKDFMNVSKAIEELSEVNFLGQKGTSA